MNEFTRAESELVDKIVAWISENPQANDDEKHGMITHLAYANTRAYAGDEDYFAATTAVIELVKEKLDANVSH